jgi:hypothetical protein
MSHGSALSGLYAFEWGPIVIGGQGLVLRAQNKTFELN